MSNFSTDGPNFEAVFRGMKILGGTNPEDVKIIVRFLRFYRDSEEFQMFADHYLPKLPPDVAAEFTEKKVLPASEVEGQVEEAPVVETTVAEKPKKKGRLSQKS